MATVQLMLDVVLFIHGIVSTGYGGTLLFAPEALEAFKGPAELPMPMAPAHHMKPGVLPEAFFLALEALEKLPGVLGAAALKGHAIWQSRYGLPPGPLRHDERQHLLWFRLYGLHLMVTGLLAIAMGLFINDRRVKLWSTRGLWLYLTVAWVLALIDARYGGVAAQARGAVVIVGSLSMIYGLILASLTLTWPRAEGQRGTFSDRGHATHHQRQVEHEKKHHEG